MKLLKLVKLVKLISVYFFDISTAKKLVKLLKLVKLVKLISVYFFDISTAKKAQNPHFFYTFDFQMCFAPQRRALFRHLNLQKWSETVSF